MRYAQNNNDARNNEENLYFSFSIIFCTLINIEFFEFIYKCYNNCYNFVSFQGESF
jgi:hypothetical protein